MQRTQRTTAGNRYHEVLQALKGGHDNILNKRTLTFSSPVTTPVSEPEETQDTPLLHYRDMSVPSVMDQHLAQEAPHSAPVTRHAKRSVPEPRTIHSEIAKLEAQCEQLNLELAKVRLEKKQSDLTKALALELQPVKPKDVGQAINQG